MRIVEFQASFPVSNELCYNQFLDYSLDIIEFNISMYLEENEETYIISNYNLEDYDVITLGNKQVVSVSLTLFEATDVEFKIEEIKSDQVSGINGFDIHSVGSNLNF